GQLGAVERRVGFSVAVDAFAHHLLDPTPIEVRVELGAASTGPAVHRPRPSPRLEGDVVSRVPVAAGHHQRRDLGGAAEGRADGVATRHGEGSAGTEVNLRIDYEKRVARPEGRGHPAYYWLASGPQRARAGDRGGPPKAQARPRGRARAAQGSGRAHEGGGPAWRHRGQPRVRAGQG